MVYLPGHAAKNGRARVSRIGIDRTDVIACGKKSVGWQQRDTGTRREIEGRGGREQLSARKGVHIMSLARAVLGDGDTYRYVEVRVNVRPAPGKEATGREASGPSFAAAMHSRGSLGDGCRYYNCSFRRR